MRVRPTAAVLLFAAVTLSAQSGGQAPASGGQAPSPVRDNVTVSVVEVPVTVVDRDGKPVRGLTAANFRIVDEGKKRPLASFDAVDFASLESLTATSPLNPAARRNFMLLFDL